MKRILVLGAGASAPYLIHYLLQHAEEHDWFVTVGDRDLEAARRRVGGHERGTALEFDVNDLELLSSQIAKADLVVNLLAPVFQARIALQCIQIGRPMVSASYRDAQLRELDREACRKGVLILCEMGLDPGIDHMTAMADIDHVKERGGEVIGLESYGGGLPAPDTIDNPFAYVITWNPRNVVMAGEKGAQFLDWGKIRIVPYHQLFQNTWTVEVPGIGTMEAYPNRDSLSYRELYGIPTAHNMIRGTIRYPGFSETWSQIARLGLANDTMRVPNLADRTWAELVDMFLPTQISGDDLPSRLANYLRISPTGHLVQNLRWLGLFAQEKTGVQGETVADAMVELLNRKLRLAAEAHDVVILQHSFEVRYPAAGGRRERITATLIADGEPGGFTAMARTVGLPAAIGVKLILTDALPLTGCHIPTHPAIYKPALVELGAAGLLMQEKVEDLGANG
jgi:saccharopine dehydrogenase-like NADP-dependent oxidoreductase